MRHILIALICFVPLIARADDKVEAARQQYLAEKIKLQAKLHLERIVMAEEIVSLLKQVKDNETAKSFGPRIDELHTRIEKHAASTVETMKNTEPEVKQAVMDQISSRMLNARKDMTTAHNKLLKEQPAAYQVLTKHSAFTREVQQNAEKEALGDVEYLQEALTRYLEEMPHGPGNLQELLDWKEKPYTPFLPKTKDIWGQEYQFKVVTTYSGDKDDVRTEVKGYVWTISPYGDGKKIIGKKP